MVSSYRIIVDSIQFFRFFFDLQKPGIFELLLFMFEFALMIQVVLSVTNLLLFFTANNISAHFKVLQTQYRDLFIKKNELRSEDELKQLIKRHLEILECCQYLKDAFVPILLVQLVIFALLIGVGGYQVIIV